LKLLAKQKKHFNNTLGVGMAFFSIFKNMAGADFSVPENQVMEITFKNCWTFTKMQLELETILAILKLEMTLRIYFCFKNSNHNPPTMWSVTLLHISMAFSNYLLLHKILWLECSASKNICDQVKLISRNQTMLNFGCDQYPGRENGFNVRGKHPREDSTQKKKSRPPYKMRDVTVFVPKRRLWIIKSNVWVNFDQSQGSNSKTF
jgi:hypothetical protein